MGQWELLDETPEGRLFSANAATRELVRGKEASLGHFVDHQVFSRLGLMQDGACPTGQQGCDCCLDKHVLMPATLII